MPKRAAWSKLLPEEREAIINRAASGESVDDIAREYNLNTSSLRRALRYERSGGRKGQRTPRGGVKVESQGNYASVESTDVRIKTLAQLLEAAQVDLSVWRVERHVINKWEVGAVNRDINLSYTKGAATGHVRKKGIVVEPLWQVKAWLCKREPEAIHPTIQPIECPQYRIPTATPTSGSIGSALILCDPQIAFERDLHTMELSPWHDWRAMDVAVQLAESLRPDRIVILGDYLDNPEWSDKYIKGPEFHLTTQASIIAGHLFLRLLREAAPDATITLLEGNHDERMTKMLIKHLHYAYDLRPVDELDLPPSLSVPRLLALHKLGVEWVGDYPSGAVWLNDGVRLCHGELARAPGDTARAVAQKSHVTEIFGHIHRIEYVPDTKHGRDGRVVNVGFSAGCLCHIDGRVHGNRARQQWQQGCAVIEYAVDGREHTIHPIVIENGRAIFQRRWYEARVDEAGPALDKCN
jgi:transposase-like protein